MKKRKSNVILLASALLVLAGAGIKLAHLPYGDWTIIGGMALGIVGLNSYINEIKKEQKED